MYFIQPLFIIPILKSDDKYIFSNEELNFIQSLTKINKKGHFVSLDKNILFNPILSNMQSKILEAIQVYVDNIIQPKNKLEFYITQSWVNFLQRGSEHPIHSHPNSILSGCIYINVVNDKLTFINPIFKALQITSQNYNLYNAITHSISVETGDIIIFDSSLQHTVLCSETEERVSIAFNVFVRGEIGDEDLGDLLILS